MNLITLVGGIKGGVGKSTIATNLAVLHASYGLKTLLIDGDEQRSASDWAAQRMEYYKDKYCDHEVTTIALSGKHLFAEVNKMSKDYDRIVIDAGGRDTTSQRSALMIADHYVIPFKPRSFDVWTMNAVQHLYEEARVLNPKLKSHIIINQADARGSDNVDAKGILLSMASFKGRVSFIGNRKAFANAASDGLSVCEISQDTKALDELINLYKGIYE